MAISPQRLTVYLYSAHRAVIFAIAQNSCFLYCHLSGFFTAPCSAECCYATLSRPYRTSVRLRRWYIPWSYSFEFFWK